MHYIINNTVKLNWRVNRSTSRTIYIFNVSSTSYDEKEGKSERAREKCLDPCMRINAVTNARLSRVK